MHCLHMGERYVLIVWTNMSDLPYTVERGDCFTSLHIQGCELESKAYNFERYEVVSEGRLKDLLDEDKWYSWEEQEYFSTGIYEAMIPDNQLKRLEAA